MRIPNEVFDKNDTLSNLTLDSRVLYFMTIPVLVQIGTSQPHSMQSLHSSSMVYTK